MIGDDQFGMESMVYTASEAAERRLGSEQIGCRGRSEGDDDFGLDDLNLLKEKRLAGVGFDWLRHTVLGWAAFHYIRDIDLFALEAHGGDHVVEQLAASADEGQTLCVFIRARTLTDEHEPRVGIAVSED